MVTPMIGELDDPEAIELLRSHFHALFEQPMPRQVVVNLEFVHYVNAQAIGVLLAHHFRLDRAGGCLANLSSARESWPFCIRSGDHAGRMPPEPRRGRSGRVARLRSDQRHRLAF